VQAQQRCHNFGLPDEQPKSIINIWRQLLKAGDLLSIESQLGPTVIAGYPWFNDWGRDTLIALPGLANNAAL